MRCKEQPGLNGTEGASSCCCWNNDSFYVAYWPGRATVDAQPSVQHVPIQAYDRYVLQHSAQSNKYLFASIVFLC